MSDPMTQDQFDQIQKQFEKVMSRLDAQDAKFDAQGARNDARFERIEENMMRKSDLYPAIMTIQSFTLAVIVGLTVVFNATIGFG